MGDGDLQCTLYIHCAVEEFNVNFAIHDAKRVRYRIILYAGVQGPGAPTRAGPGVQGPGTATGARPGMQGPGTATGAGPGVQGPGTANGAGPGVQGPGTATGAGLLSTDDQV